MRIVDRDTFLKLPAGTAFFATDRINYRDFGALSIKGNNVGDNDWAVLEIGDVSSDESSQMFDRLDEMFGSSSVSYPMELDFGRDGSFDADGRYLVLETADIEALIGLLTTARRAAASASWRTE